MQRRIIMILVPLPVPHESAPGFVTTTVTVTPRLEVIPSYSHHAISEGMQHVATVGEIEKWT